MNVGEVVGGRVGTPAVYVGESVGDTVGIEEGEVDGFGVGEFISYTGERVGHGLGNEVGSFGQEI